MPRLHKFVLVAGAAALGIYIMVVGKAILLPLVVSVVVWYLINVLAASYRRSIFIPLPAWLCLPAAVLTFVALVWAIGSMLVGNLTAIADTLPRYQPRLEQYLAAMTETLGLSAQLKVSDLLGGMDLRALAGSIAASLATLAGSAGLVFIYVLFLLLEQGGFDRKMTALFSDKQKEGEARAILTKIGNDLQTYMRIKLLLSLVLAVYGFVVLELVGVSYAAFWASLFFLFNFIPTVGWILAVIGPALFALLEFQGIGPFLIVVLGIGGVQVVVNNFLEPALMGRSLNLSPFVIILSLVVFGALWGLVGMVLSVPIMVAVMIILAHFQKTRGLAILMSANGEISDQAVKAP